MQSPRVSQDSCSNYPKLFKQQQILTHFIIKALSLAHTHLNMWEVTVLKLQKNLQSALLVELFQSLDCSII